MPPKAANNDAAPPRKRRDGNKRQLFGVTVYDIQNKSELPLRESIVREILLACLNISFIIVSYGDFGKVAPFTIEVLVKFNQNVSSLFFENLNSFRFNFYLLSTYFILFIGQSN